MLLYIFLAGIKGGGGGGDGGGSAARARARVCVYVCVCARARVCVYVCVYLWRGRAGMELHGIEGQVILLAQCQPLYRNTCMPR